MSIQVLVATMNQVNNSLSAKMNIQTEAIIGNQCEKNEIRHFNHNNRLISYYSFKEKGVGLNRNNTLMRATADYCLIADDDMVYIDGYEDIIENEFRKHKDADIIIFNLKEEEPKRFYIKEEFNVTYFNFMRFGAARIAFKTSKIKKNGIFFNLCFGGGTNYSNGEDTLFLKSCLDKKLKIKAVPIEIAKLSEERASTWFNGYDEKYFYDKGVLYRSVSKKYSKILCFQDLIRHRKLYGNEKKLLNLYKVMRKGIKEY